MNAVKAINRTELLNRVGLPRFQILYCLYKLGQARQIDICHEYTNRFEPISDALVRYHLTWLGQRTIYIKKELGLYSLASPELFKEIDND